MALDTLDPQNLARTVGCLALAQALVLDVLRGRSVTKDDASTVRQAFGLLRKTLDALDDQAGWNAVPNTRLIVQAGDALAAASADAALVSAWHLQTDPWRG